MTIQYPLQDKSQQSPPAERVGGSTTAALGQKSRPWACDVQAPNRSSGLRADVRSRFSDRQRRADMDTHEEQSDRLQQIPNNVYMSCTHVLVHANGRGANHARPSASPLAGCRQEVYHAQRSPSFILCRPPISSADQTPGRRYSLCCHSQKHTGIVKENRGMVRRKNDANVVARFLYASPTTPSD